MAEWSESNGVIYLKDQNDKPRMILASDGFLRTRDSQNETDGNVGSAHAGAASAVFSHTGNATTGVGVATFPITGTSTIVGVYASCNTAPTGNDLIFDVNKNGTTIFTTQGNRPKIVAVSTHSAAIAVPDVTACGLGDLLTVDIDQIGSSVAGADITVIVLVSSS